ncbi:unnamed protein product [Linum trigynum]|uniref:Reverse transcriptase zinc-binding domain-containing protein n=1 Tax=Linum trigynum TaxID=586398 RepID=A0AAV2FAS5_9ROSI
MSCFKLPLSLCRLLDRHVARFWWGDADDHFRIRWVSWRNLCRSKHDGGLGFRRFEQFNQALLAKIGWRILMEPQSLLAQVYKGKYFPNGSFLEASARSRPSWGWQSILFGRELLAQGLRWQIGNGQTVALLDSNWIPKLQMEPPCYNPRILPEGGKLLVAEVMRPGEGCWDDLKLCQWFDPPTCQAIKTIPLLRQDVLDKLIWHGTADGVFTVKSAYHLAVDRDKRKGGWRSTVGWMGKEDWVRVWNANIPPKLKVFLWQIFNRILPTTEALIDKHVLVQPRCPVCWACTESMEHLFLDCPVARALWDYSGLGYLGEGLPRHTFPMFLKRLLALIHQPSLFMAVVAVLWRIWRSRNWVVFEGKQFGFPALLRQFHQQYEEWVRLPLDKGPLVVTQMGAPAGGPHLHPTGEDSVICMWDSAVRQGSHSAGGVVLLTPTREVWMAKGFQFPCIDDPMVVELLVLREAMWWCLEAGLSGVRFEGDAKVLIDKINQKDARDDRVGAVLEELLQICSSSPGFRVRFVGRRSNRVAHLVACKALSLYPTGSRFFDFQAWLNSRL